MVHLPRPLAEDSLELLPSPSSSPSVRLPWFRSLCQICRSVRRSSACSWFRSVLVLDVCLYLLFIWSPLSEMRTFVPVGVRETKRFLLLVAHPDDECLFFAPTILRLISRGVEGHLLVVSQGNYEGLGEIRQRELKDSCRTLGISLSRCLSLNRTELVDHPNQWWPEDLLVALIGEYLVKHSIDLLISFDRGGISGHINHRSLAVALESSSLNRSVSSLSIYSLRSVSPLFKFTSFFDVLPTLFVFLPRLFFSSSSSSSFLVVSSPVEYLRTLNAFHRHRSQQRWFRHFYTLFSRYMFINDLQSIETRRTSLIPRS